MQEATWYAKDSQDNALATATKAAVANQKHVITHVSASFSAAATKLLQIKHGTTVVWEGYVVNSLVVDLTSAFPAAGTNTAVSAELAASGTASVLGKVNLAGYTEQA